MKWAIFEDNGYGNGGKKEYLRPMEWAVLEIGGGSGGEGEREERGHKKVGTPLMKRYPHGTL